MTDKINLSVIIPVYNEAATCGEIIKRVQAISSVYEIIVVDDASTDGTIQILETIDNIKVIRHEQNNGKGATVRTVAPFPLFCSWRMTLILSIVSRI